MINKKNQGKGAKVRFESRIKRRGSINMSLSTKRAMAEAFKKLLSQRGMDKITVKDIVEECGLNRQTFYFTSRCMAAFALS